jgi:hypothetical protein
VISSTGNLTYRLRFTGERGQQHRAEQAELDQVSFRFHLPICFIGSSFPVPVKFYFVAPPPSAVGAAYL